MEDKILELIDILEKEMFLYEESLNTTSREKDAMQRYFLEEMLDCQKSRMSLNLRIGELEKIRKGITDEIAAKKGVSFKALTLKDIIVDADGETKERLENCRLGLKRLLAMLSAAMDDAGRVAVSSLKFVDRSIKLLSGYEVDKMTYRSNGIMEKHDRHPGRLMKEV